MKIEIPGSPLEWVRSKPEMYWGEQPFTRELLALRLADSALTSGAQRLVLQSGTDGWMTVSASGDWITSSLPETHHGFSLQRVFKAIVPQVGGRQNEMRAEIIVTAYSSAVAVKSSGNWIVIEGEEPPEAVRALVSGDEFAVALREKPRVRGTSG